MASILKQRRDTAANWTAANPVIPDGQLCFDTTNNTFRIGDGTTVHDSLPIQSGAPGADGADGADGGGLTALVNDTTPQLGGDLDLNGNVITGLDTGANAALSNLSGVAGTSGQVMTSDGAGNATMQDAAAGGGGKVLQVARGYYNGFFQTSGSNWVTICSATFSNALTAGSSVLILSNTWGGSNWGKGPVTTFRGSTNLADTYGKYTTGNSFNQYAMGNLSDYRGFTVAYSILDTSPATSYYLKVASLGSNVTVGVPEDNTSSAYGQGSSSIIIMEIGA